MKIVNRSNISDDNTEINDETTSSTLVDMSDVGRKISSSKVYEDYGIGLEVDTNESEPYNGPVRKIRVLHKKMRYCTIKKQTQVFLSKT